MLRTKDRPSVPIGLLHLTRRTEPAARVTYEPREVEGDFSLRDALAPVTGG